MTHAMIWVVSEIPSGAFRLYESLGFEAIHGTITSELQVNSPALTT